MKEQVMWGTVDAPVCDSASTMTVFLVCMAETRTLNRLLLRDVAEDCGLIDIGDIAVFDLG
jgi:hypothetical protein